MQRLVKALFRKPNYSFSSDVPRIRSYSVTAESISYSAKITTENNQVLVSDLSKQSGGQGNGISPLELFLSSLVACESVTSQVISKNLGFKITTASYQINGQRDDRGYHHLPLTSEAPVTSNFTRIWGTIHAETDATQEQLNQLNEILKKRCPIARMIIDSGCIKFKGKNKNSYQISGFGQDNYKLTEILFSTEFDNTTPISQYKQMKCNQGFWVDFNFKYIVGQYDKNLNSSPIIRTYSSLPPHWSLAFSFDLIIYNIINWKIQDKLDILVDNNKQDTYSFENISPSRSFCLQNQYDTLKLYHVNVTHSQPSVQLQIKSSFVSSTASYGIRNILLHLETCDQSCLTCNGPTSNNCLSCPSNFSLVGTQCKCSSGFFAYLNTCLQQCPQGYLQNQTNNQCELDNCDSTKCQICSPSPKRKCLACVQGFFLHIDKCVSICPPYAPLTNNVCQDPILSLKNGKYALKGLFGQSFGESEIKGMNLQYISFYGNGLENLSTGNPHYQLTISFTAYIIDSWDAEQFYVQIDGTQIVNLTEDFNYFPSQICGLNEYYDKVEKITQTIPHASTSVDIIVSSNLDENPYNESFGIRDLYILLEACTDNCVQCNDSGCQKCKDGYALYQSLCYQLCPDGFWNNSGICQVCDPNCLKCNGTDSKSCTACKNGQFLYNNTCVNACPDIQYYPDTSSNVCKPCDVSCYKCQNPDSYKCVQQCKSNYFADQSDQTCKPCDSNCLTCSNSSAQCLTCQLPLKLQTKTKKCVNNCDDDQYFDSVSNSCLPCDQNCKGCVNSSTQCTSCSQPNYLKQSQCTNNCGSSYFGDSSDQKCKKCDSTCLTCSGANDNQCITCVSPLLLYQSEKQCKQTCRSDQFLDKSNNTCILCNQGCQKCFGPNSDQCISCNLPKVLQGNQCQANCNNGFYISTNNTCNPCDSNCLNCVNTSTKCSSCQIGQFLDIVSKKCVSKCQNSQYLDVKQQYCAQCNQLCNTCQGPSASDCLSCNLPLVLQGNNCKQNCDNGYYLSLPSQKCIACSSNCQTCKNESTQCLTCQSGLFLDQVQKKCISKCQDNQYFDQLNQTCVNCDDNCQTCKGPQSSDCLSCFSQKQLIGSVCAEVCKDGQYLEVTICKNCHQSCYKCNGQQNNQCTKCQHGSYLYNNMCILQCPDNMFQDENLFECLKCHESCLNNGCYGPSIFECKKDNLNFYQSLIVKIIAGKTIFWLISCIIGFILDRRDKKLYSNKVLLFNDQSIKESSRGLQSNQILDQDNLNPQMDTTKRRKRQRFLNSQATGFTLTSANIVREQNIASFSQNSNLKVYPSRNPRVRCKASLILSQVSTNQGFNLDQINTNDLSPIIRTKSSQQQSLFNQESKSSNKIEQDQQVCSQIYPEVIQSTTQDYLSDQKLKYTFKLVYLIIQEKDIKKMNFPQQNQEIWQNFFPQADKQQKVQNNHNNQNFNFNNNNHRSQNRFDQAQKDQDWKGDYFYTEINQISIPIPSFVSYATKLKLQEVIQEIQEQIDKQISIPLLKQQVLAKIHKDFVLKNNEIIQRVNDQTNNQSQTQSQKEVEEKYIQEKPQIEKQIREKPQKEKYIYERKQKEKQIQEKPQKEKYIYERKQKEKDDNKNEETKPAKNEDNQNLSLKNHLEKQDKLFQQGLQVKLQPDDARSDSTFKSNMIGKESLFQRYQIFNKNNSVSKVEELKQFIQTIIQTNNNQKQQIQSEIKNYLQKQQIKQQNIQQDNQKNYLKSFLLCPEDYTFNYKFLEEMLNNINRFGVDRCKIYKKQIQTGMFMSETLSIDFKERNVLKTLTYATLHLLICKQDSDKAKKYICNVLEYINPSSKGLEQDNYILRQLYLLLLQIVIQYPDNHQEAITTFLDNVFKFEFLSALLCDRLIFAAQKYLKQQQTNDIFILADQISAKLVYKKKISKMNFPQKNQESRQNFFPQPDQQQRIQNNHNNQNFNFNNNNHRSQNRFDQVQKDYDWKSDYCYVEINQITIPIPSFVSNATKLKLQEVIQEIHEQIDKQISVPPLKQQVLDKIHKDFVLKNNIIVQRVNDQTNNQSQSQQEVQENNIQDKPQKEKYIQEKPQKEKYIQEKPQKEKQIQEKPQKDKGDYKNKEKKPAKQDDNQNQSLKNHLEKQDKLFQQNLQVKIQPDDARSDSTFKSNMIGRESLFQRYQIFNKNYSVSKVEELKLFVQTIIQTNNSQKQQIQSEIKNYLQKQQNKQQNYKKNYKSFLLSSDDYNFNYIFLDEMLKNINRFGVDRCKIDKTQIQTVMFMSEALSIDFKERNVLKTLTYATLHLFICKQNSDKAKKYICKVLDHINPSSKGLEQDNYILRQLYLLLLQIVIKYSDNHQESVTEFLDNVFKFEFLSALLCDHLIFSAQKILKQQQQTNDIFVLVDQISKANKINLNIFSNSDNQSYRNAKKETSEIFIFSYKSLKQNQQEPVYYIINPSDSFLIYARNNK
ncbi:hypothetical protein ABPG73_005595 [Tetrahymena malaccensis]